MPPKKSRTNKRRKPRSKKHALIPPVAINRNPGFTFDRMRTTLRFNAFGTINNAGVQHTSARWEPTFVYDVDPVLGSTSVPGFAELGTMYRRYRVNSFRYYASFSNLEAFPALFWTCPVNNDPGANTAIFQAFQSSIYSKKKMVGALTGNGVCVLKGTVSVAEFGGLAAALVDDSTSASTTGTAPANNIWLAVGMSTNSNLTSGFLISIDFDIDMDFYELTSPAT